MRNFKHAITGVSIDLIALWVMKFVPFIIVIWIGGFGVYLILKDFLNYIKEVPFFKRYVFFFKLPVNLYSTIIALIIVGISSQVHYIKENRDLRNSMVSNKQDKSEKVRSRLLNFYERIIFLKENIPNDWNSPEYPEYFNETVNEVLVFSNWITENAGALRTHIFEGITYHPYFSLEEALYGGRKNLDINLERIERNLNKLIENNKWKNYVNR